MRQSRSAYYYQSVKDDTEVIDTLREWAEKHNRYGFWLLYKRMRRNGIPWNHKRLYRVYKLLNLSMRRKGKKRIPARVKEPLDHPSDINKNWSMDFMSDSLASGQRFRTLNIMDDFNREILHIEVSTSLPSKRVVRILDQLKDWRGLPEQIRVDNGPEFIGAPLTEWAVSNDVRILFIQPGKPMQNGFIERFNKTYRTEILDQYLFFSLQEAREITGQWMEDYNCHRPHDSLDDFTPVEYAGRRALTVDNSIELPTINTLSSSSNLESKSIFTLS